MTNKKIVISKEARETIVNQVTEAMLDSLYEQIEQTQPTHDERLLEESIEIQSKLAPLTSEPFEAMLSSKPLNILPKVKPSKMEYDKISNTFTGKIGEVGVKIKAKTPEKNKEDGKKTRIDPLKLVNKELSLDSLKLMKYTMIKLASQNTYREQDIQKLNSIVRFSTKEYGEELGLEMSQNGIKKLSRRLRKVSKELSDFQFELDNGTPYSFGFLNPIASMEVTSNYIEIECSLKFLHNLVNSQVSQYNKKFLSIGNSTEFNLMNKMYENYIMPSNIKRRRNDILSVKTLVSVASFQDYEELLKNKQRNWKAKIAIPLKNALERLVDQGFLQEYYFCKAKGEILEDPLEDENTKSYYQYEQLYVKYRIKECSVPPDTLQLIREANEKPLK